jgi:signal recognition particle receptor subunit beta
VSFINLREKIVQVKIVYYGPGRGGKTTNLEYINRKFSKQIQSEMVSLKTHGDRTLFFDFLPFNMGQIKGYDLKIQLYTVPGQVKYNATRKLVLKGVDGVVFVADSQEARMDANAESLQNLEKNLRDHGFDLATIPYVLQLNKRDLPTAIPADEMYRQLNYKGEPTFEATAPTGIGVFDTLKAVAKQVLMELRKK